MTHKYKHVCSPKHEMRRVRMELNLIELHSQHFNDKSTKNKHKKEKPLKGKEIEIKYFIQCFIILYKTVLNMQVHYAIICDNLS